MRNKFIAQLIVSFVISSQCIKFISHHIFRSFTCSKASKAALNLQGTCVFLSYDLKNEMKKASLRNLHSGNDIMKDFFSPTSLSSRSFCALAKSSSLLSFRLAPPMLTFGFRLKSPSKNPFIVSLCFQTPMSLWYNLDIFDLSDDQWWVFFLLDFLEKLRKTADSMFTFRSKMTQVYNFKIILWPWRVTNKPESFENCKKIIHLSQKELKP